MFAIQYGLILSCVLSSITGLSGVLDTPGTAKRFFGTNYPTTAIFVWNFKMLFGSLLFVYALNVVVAVYAPLTTLAYVLACGNLIRVCFVMQYVVSAEKLALMGLVENGKMLKIIVVVQVTLAAVIAGCAYVSSSDPEYVAYAGAITPTDRGSYSYFVYFFCAVGILGRIPQVLNPMKAAKRFMAEGRALPSDKGELLQMEFTFGFTAINYLQVWAFVLALTFFVPTMTPIAGFMTLAGGVLIAILVKTILGIDEIGFAIPPMLFFLTLISVMFGASVLTLLA
eukprot:scaffold59465_cov63-Phaeocystis_antarctica.AAC.3